MTSDADSVVERAARALYKVEYPHEEAGPFKQRPKKTQDWCRVRAREMLAAANLLLSDAEKASDDMIERLAIRIQNHIPRSMGNPSDGSLAAGCIAAAREILDDKALRLNTEKREELGAWIEREFAGHGRAIRGIHDTPYPDEPYMSMEDAKELTRRAVAQFAQPVAVDAEKGERRVPDGWKLVPDFSGAEGAVELAMLKAGKESLYSCSEDPEIEDARNCFQAMLAVVSAPPLPAVGEAGELDREARIEAEDAIEEIRKLLVGATPEPWTFQLAAIDDDATLVGPNGDPLKKRDAKLMACVRNFLEPLLAAADRGLAPRSPTDADMRAFGASDAACYKWPDDTLEHRACRAAYIEGSADSPPTDARREAKVFSDLKLLKSEAEQLRKNPTSLAIRCSREHYLFLAAAIEQVTLDLSEAHRRLTLGKKQFPDNGPIFEAAGSVEHALAELEALP